MPPASVQAADWELLGLHRPVMGRGEEPPPPGQQPDTFPETSGSFFQLCQCLCQPESLPKAGGQRVAVMGWARSRWSKPAPTSRQPGDGEGTQSSAGPAPGSSGGGCRERAAQPRPGAPARRHPGALPGASTPPAWAARGLTQPRLTPSGTPAQRTTRHLPVLG